jgi:hypothetical protein
MAQQRTVSAVFALVEQEKTLPNGDKTIVYTSVGQGLPLPEGTTDAEIARLDGLGALHPVKAGDAGTASVGALERAQGDEGSIARAHDMLEEDGVAQPANVSAGTVTATGEPAELVVPDGPPDFDVHAAGPDAVEEWLRSGVKPADVIEAVGDSPATARKVLEAEDRVQDGTPRSSLTKRLTPIANRG